MKQGIFFLTFFFLIIYADHDHDWNYQEYGPDVWSETYPTCGGQFQSPIDILTACTVYKNFTPFVFTNGYHENHNFILKNNGHTIVGSLNIQGQLPDFKLTGGNLNGTFEFINFHLHWGENHKSGSEHEVNGIPYSGEIHFVHSNSVTNQTAVLGIFMQSLFLTNETQNNTRYSYDEDTKKEWEKFFDVAQILQYEDNLTIINLNLTLLMGDNLNNFWRYQGSLTTPPCTENVIWTIFKEPIIFYENELESFRKNIYFEDYRRPQPLYNRSIYRNFFNETLSTIPDYNCCSKNDKSTASYRSTNSIFLVIFIFFLFFVLCFDILE